MQMMLQTKQLEGRRSTEHACSICLNMRLHPWWKSSNKLSTALLNHSLNVGLHPWRKYNIPRIQPQFELTRNQYNESNSRNTVELYEMGWIAWELPICLHTITMGCIRLDHLVDNHTRRSLPTLELPQPKLAAAAAETTIACNAQHNKQRKL